MKRFQECNWIVKAWRWLRWRPYMRLRSCYWIVRWTLRGCPASEDMSRKETLSHLWFIGLSLAHSRMNWVYTCQELMQELQAEAKPQ